MFEPLTTSRARSAPRAPPAAAGGQADAGEARGAVDQLEKRIVGPLVGTAGERAQCLVLAERIEPTRLRRARHRPPVLDRQGELCLPEQQRRQRREELIAVGVE